MLHIIFPTKFKGGVTMPGMLCHLMFAEKVYRKLILTINLDRLDFLSGNLLPDLATDKKSSHFQVSTPIECLEIPNIHSAQNILFDINDSLKFGAFCHLYLDYYFIKNFLIPNFIWNIDNMTIINPNNNYQWTILDFFSDKGLYGAYTETNHLILRDGYVSSELISLIPDELPKSGIPCFDSRKQKSWKQELNEYLSNEFPYTGTLLDYDALIDFTINVANNFVERDFSLFLGKH